MPEPMPYGKVLVVDDVETNRQVAQGLLGLYKIGVETVDSGRAALEKVKSGQVYDIIFMDHMMPDMNGIETTKILRSMGYDHPIVALSANALVGQAEVFFKSGLDAFIPKPIQTERLDAVLVKFIKSRYEDDIEDTEVDVEDTIDSIDTDAEVSDYYDRPEIQSLMRQDFIENQKNSMVELHNALEERDFESASRVAHTLKSLARYMKAEALTESALNIEIALANCETLGLSADVLWALEEEFTKVLKEVEADLLA